MKQHHRFLASSGPGRVPLMFLLLAASMIPPCSSAAGTGNGNGYNTASGGQPHIRWLQLQLAGAQLNIDFENERRKIVYATDGRTLTEDSLYAASLVDLYFKGSMVHPYLIDFSLHTGLGYAWDRDTTSESERDVESNSFLQNYEMNMWVLMQKPYGFQLFASRRRHRREYDFFDRVTVETERYGGSFGYRHPRLRFGVDLERWQEEEPSAARSSLRKEQSFSSYLTDNHGAGQNTHLQYDIDSYLHKYEDDTTLDGTTHEGRLTDTRSFGMNDRNRLSSSLGYTLRRDNATGHESLNWSLTEDLQLTHASSLSDRIHYRLSEASAGDYTTREHAGEWELRHQLYKSLTSTFTLDALLREDDESTGPGAENHRYGAGIQEDYNKLLGSVGTLNLAAAYRTFEDTYTAGGDIVSVIDERHRLTDGTVTLLNYANVVIPSITLTDGKGKTRYQESLDYRIIPRGEYVQIERVFGGDIPNGALVLANYQAQHQPTDTSSGNEQRYKADLSLFDRRLNIYGRIDDLDSTGAGSIAIAERDERVIGANVRIMRITLGGEFERDRSRSVSYDAVRTYQSIGIPAGRGSTLNLHATQTTLEYQGSDRKEWTESYIARYNTRISRRCTFSAQGGFRKEEREDYNRDSVSARATLKYAVRSLSTMMSYEYEEESDSAQDRQEQFVSVKIVRRF